MKKIIIAAIIIIAVAAITWFIFIKRPVFLNQLLPQKAVSEPVVASSSLSGELDGLNPYEEAYTNPFK